MSSTVEQLARFEEILDASRVPARIEALLPVGVRPRQLSVRSLLIGMLIALGDHRPAHLRRVHETLIARSEQEQRRLGVLTDWKTGEHLLTYRQVERTFGLIVKALAKQKPDGSPSAAPSEIIDALLEASVQTLGPPQSSALAVDWSDYESFARPPRKRGTQEKDAQEKDAQEKDGEPAYQDTEPDAPQKDRESADSEASWGHRRGDAPGQKDEAFYGYYLQAATIVREEHGPEVPELVRRISLTSCHVDPPGRIRGSAPTDGE